MFHRRLLLLVVFFLLGGAGLTARVARLTIVDHDALLREAERRLVAERWIETVRGRILDRNGRVLAMDRPSFDITVDYSVITGEWALSNAARAARRAAGEQWLRLSPAQRDALIERHLPEYQDELESMWSEFASIAGIDREELERRKGRVIAQVQRMAVSVWERRRLARQEELSRDRETTIQIPLADVARPIREQVQPHALVRSADDGTAFAFRRLAERAPGINVVDGSARAYPHETMDVVVDLSTFPANLRQERSVSMTVRGVGTHLLGWMRDQVYEEDIEQRKAKFGDSPRADRGHYRPGDAVGAAGLERSMEDSLRGLRGRAARRLDTGEVERIEPTPGEDAQLAIDIQLQAHVQALLDPALGLAEVQEWHGGVDGLPLGTALAAGAAVIDIRSGHALALATWPTFTREELQTDSERIWDDPVLAPSISRATDRPYAPGSIVKPLTLASAVTAGSHPLDARIECHGHLLPDRPDIYRCWIYRDRFGFMTHTMQTGGPLDAAEAIARSCNIYFYNVGRSLGAERLAGMYRALGVGERRGGAMAIASPGFIGHMDGSPFQFSDALFLAMGQGPVSWTPLHAADAYATLARGGVRIDPKLTLADEPTRVDLNWRRDAVDRSLEGLRRGVNEEYGTGHHYTLPTGRQNIFNAPGVRIAGKTGTAQAGPITEERDGEFVSLRSGDHSWTAALVGPPSGPYEYAIAVVVEYGGSGSRVAGPIVNQIVHALIDHGYMEGVGP